MDFPEQYVVEVDRAREGGGTEVHLLPRLDEKNEEEGATPVTPMINHAGDEDDDFMSEKWESYIPEPPDGGWGWIIMIASFMSNFIVDGIAYCFGVFLNEYAHDFDASIGATSLSNSLLCGVYLLIGPIVGALVNKYGCRTVTIVGALIGALAFVLSTFSPSIYVFQFVYGIIGGCGFGLMYLPAVVGVGFYFEKKRSIATGIAVCGTGIGTFCLAPLGKVFLEEFGWKNAHYFLAGLIMQDCIFGALMRPLVAMRKKPSKKKRKDYEPSPRTAQSSKVDSDDVFRHPIPANLPPDQKKSSSNVTRSNYALSVGKPRNRSTTGREMGSSKLHASAFLSTSGIRDRETIIQDLRRPLYRKDIFYSGSVYNIPRRKPSMTATSVASYVSTYDRLACLRKLPKPMADILAEMLDLKVLKNKGMLILSLGNIVGFAGFYVPIVFSSDRAVQLGVSKGDAALLISIMGICNTVGRVLSGLLSFIPSVSPLLVNNISIVLSGLCVLITPFCTTFTTMALAIAGYGLFGATFISLASILICELVGVEKLTNGFGLICLVRGITAIAAPPLEGLLYDITGTYDATFYMGGVALLLSGACHSLLFMSCLRQSNKDDTGITNTEDTTNANDRGIVQKVDMEISDTVDRKIPNTDQSRPTSNIRLSTELNDLS